MKKTISLVVSALALLTLGGTALSSTAQASSLDDSKPSYSWSVHQVGQPIEEGVVSTITRSSYFVKTPLILNQDVMVFDTFAGHGRVISVYKKGTQLTGSLYTNQTTGQQNWLLDNSATADHYWINASSASIRY